MAMGEVYAAGILLMALVSSGHSMLKDLTFAVDNDTLVLPAYPPFRVTPVTVENYSGVDWFQWEYFSTATHLGTHIDAPLHLNQNSWSVDNIPLDRLIVPGVFIDIRYKSDINPDTYITVEDVENWEKKYGRIPKGAGVFQCAGWYTRYPNETLYFGNDIKNTSDYHFPSFSIEAVQWLYEKRGIVGIGVDTPSLDWAQLHQFPVHVYVADNNIYGLELMGNTCGVPPNGTTVYIFPYKIKGASGAPTRVIVQWDDKKEQDKSSAQEINAPGNVLPMMFLLFIPLIMV